MKTAQKAPFHYLGMEFTPLRQFNKQEKEIGLSLPMRTIGISNYDKELMPIHTRISAKWNYEAFYAEAKKVGADKIDIFMWQGKQVIPCGNELFEYDHSRISA